MLLLILICLAIMQDLKRYSLNIVNGYSVNSYVKDQNFDNSEQHNTKSELINDKEKNLNEIQITKDDMFSNILLKDLKEIINNADYNENTINKETEPINNKEKDKTQNDYNDNKIQNDDNNRSMTKHDGRHFFQVLENLWKLPPETATSKIERSNKNLFLVKPANNKTVGNLEKVLNRLANELKHLNGLLEQQRSDSNSVFLVKLPAVLKFPNDVSKGKRTKREDNPSNISNSMLNNDIIVEAKDLNKIKDAFNNVREHDLIQYTSPLQENLSSEVKNKLLSYVEEKISEIIKGIRSLQELKQEYSDNNVFKMGYIVAYIDILEKEIHKLGNDTEINKEVWNEKQILDVFDKLNALNKIIARLLNSIEEYKRRNVN